MFNFQQLTITEIMKFKYNCNFCNAENIVDIVAMAQGLGKGMGDLNILSENMGISGLLSGGISSQRGNRTVRHACKECKKDNIIPG